MDQIKFKTGEFQEFTATRSFALGAFNVQIAAGATLEFDGSQVVYAGSTYAFPQLRGALTANWIVPSEEYNEGDPSYNKRQSANIKMRPPTDSTGKPAVAAVTAETDERVVLESVKVHADATKAQNNTRRASSVVEDQDGIPVRTFKTPAKRTDRTSLTAESAGAVLREAENVQIEPGKGLTADEMMARMTPEDREVYLASKASIRARYVDSEPSAKTVNTVKTAAVTQSEGVTSKQSVGGGIEIHDPTTGAGVAKKSTRTEDGITFQNTNGPTKKEQPHPRSAEAQQPIMVKDGTADTRRQIAKMVCPDFPDSYDFAAPERKKLARLQADFEDRPDVLKAVFAAESDAFKATLVAEFPQAFQG